MGTSDTGIWLDDESGEVVFSPPSKGTQIVAKGGEISAAARGRLEALGKSLPGEESDEPASEPETVTTEAAKPAAKTRKRK